MGRDIRAGITLVRYVRNQLFAHNVGCGQAALFTGRRGGRGEKYCVSAPFFRRRAFSLPVRGPRYSPPRYSAAERDSMRKFAVLSEIHTRGGARMRTRRGNWMNFVRSFEIHCESTVYRVFPNHCMCVSF